MHLHSNGSWEHLICTPIHENPGCCVNAVKARVRKRWPRFGYGSILPSQEVAFYQCFSWNLKKSKWCWIWSELERRNWTRAAVTPREAKLWRGISRYAPTTHFSTEPPSPPKSNGPQRPRSFCRPSGCSHLPHLGRREVCWPRPRPRQFSNTSPTSNCSLTAFLFRAAYPLRLAHQPRSKGHFRHQSRRLPRGRIRHSLHRICVSVVRVSLRI